MTTLGVQIVRSHATVPEEYRVLEKDLHAAAAAKAAGNECVALILARAGRTRQAGPADGGFVPFG